MSSNTPNKLFDTHTHFDFDVFDGNRLALAQEAKRVGVEKLVVAGYVAKHFGRLAQVQHELNTQPNVPNVYIAAGLHPDFIEQHSAADTDTLATFLVNYDCIAVGEIGLDTFSKVHKTPKVIAKQKAIFSDQLLLADSHKLPALLHIRKSHADAISLLKSSGFHHGGIAHSFSGGIQEAKALVNMGFYIGITAQVTNPNAKKLRSVVRQIGAAHLVVETDCPDMLPFCLHTKDGDNINTPANLTHVVDTLSHLLDMDKDMLSTILWKNSLRALQLDS